MKGESRRRPAAQNGKDSWSNHGPRIRANHYLLRFWEPPYRVFSISYLLTGFFHGGFKKLKSGRHTFFQFLFCGGGVLRPTFGLCDLTHLSMRVGLYLHPLGVLAIQSLRLPRSLGLGSVLPYRSRDLGFTDFDE